MSQHDNALFHRDGSIWHPQNLSVGPWAPDALHGGPVAALCVSAAEELLPDVNLVTTRLTLDLVKPVPTRPLEVRGEVYKQGRRVFLIEIEIKSGGKTVALASVQRTLRQPVELPDLSNSRVRLTPPADRPDDFVPFDPEKMKVVPAPFLHHATDLRTPRAAALFERDPTEAWINVHANLLPGVPLSPAAAIVAAADYGNAIGAPLPPGPGLLFPNADLTVYLVRQPESAWVRMTPSTSWLPNGIGQTRCLLDDEQGMLGTGRDAGAGKSPVTSRRRVALPEAALPRFARPTYSARVQLASHASTAYQSCPNPNGPKKNQRRRRVPRARSSAWARFASRPPTKASRSKNSPTRSPRLSRAGMTPIARKNRAPCT